MTVSITTAVIIAVIALVLGLAVGIFAGYLYRKKVAEKEIGSAEEEAKRILNDALKAAENKKREILLEAKEEGFTEIAALFEAVAKIEKEHEERYRKLIENIEGGLVFSKDGDVIWQCSNCGHIMIGKKAPEVCPVCAHPQAYFQVKAENY